MKLALKVALVTVTGILIVLVGVGIWRTRLEIALLDSDMRKEQRLVGSTLALCVARTWMLEGEEPALDLLAQARAARPELHVGWIHRDGRGDRRLTALSGPGEMPEREIGTRYLNGGERGERYLVTLFPTRVDGTRLGAIEIGESLSARDAFVRESIVRRCIIVLGTSAVAGAAILAIGLTFIGRPLDALIKKAQRVGAGDLTGPLLLEQNDEIGQLAVEMNAMCERLAAAHERSERDTAARLKATEQLRHADRLVTIGRLAAGIAHELGTPLNVIAGRAKLLGRGRFDAAVHSDYLATISEQTRHMTAIIQQLLDFARVREPKTRTVDLGIVAAAAARLIEPMARKHGVELHVIASEPVLAMGEAVQLEQVASNLIVNAIHACGAGGCVRLEVGTDHGSGSVKARAFLRVTDDGHGISPETQQRIFEPFFTTKELGHGTGLGLAVAHGIVQEHGGVIAVTSELGQGASFSVYLPLSEA